jgi:hypothetical protein
MENSSECHEESKPCQKLLEAGYLHIFLMEGELLEFEEGDPHLRGSHEGSECELGSNHPEILEEMIQLM